MKRLLLMSVLTALISLGANAEAPKGYYSSCEGQTGEPLLVKLHEKIAPHTRISYAKVWQLYLTADVDENGKIYDIYSTKRWEPSTDQCTSGTGGSNMAGHVGACYTREHSFCKSWWGGSEEEMYTDGFHLYPADYYINSYRNNWPYGECADGVARPDYDGISPLGKLGTCTFPGYTGKVYEPVDEYKGDLARGYLYMAACYYDRIATWDYADAVMLNQTSYPAFTDWALNLLLKWHRQDPVSPKELARQEAVYAVQGNRNPFIDHPELAEYIWGDKKGTAWSESATPMPAINAPVNGSALDCGTANVSATIATPLSVVCSNLTDPVTFTIGNVRWSYLPPVEPVAPEAYTYDWADPASLTPSVDEADVNPSYNLTTTYTNGCVSFDAAKNGASTAPRLYKANDGTITLRLYAGNTTTLSTTEGRIVRVEFVSSAKAMYGAFTADCGTPSDDCLSWTGNTDHLTLTWAKYTSSPESTASYNAALQNIIVYVQGESVEPSTGMLPEQPSLDGVFSVDPASLTADAANDGASVDVNFAPTGEGYFYADLVVTAGSLSSTVHLNGQGVVELTALAATDITSESFVAHWVDLDKGARNYMLHVLQGDNELAGYPVEVNSGAESYKVTDLDEATTYTYYVTRDDHQSNIVTVTTAEVEPEITVMAPEGWSGSTGEGMPVDVVLEAAEGYTSDAVTITILTAGLEGDMTVSIAEPFEVSTDMNNWSQSLTTDCLVDHVYLRLNGSKRGSYLASLNVRAGEISNDDLMVYGTVSADDKIAAVVAPTPWEAYTLGDTLVIDNRTDSALEATIYTIDGYELSVVKAAPGISNLRVAPGYYLIAANGDVRRVVVR